MINHRILKTICGKSIHVDLYNLNNDQIETLEKKFNAKYIIDTSIQDKRGNWINEPVSIFWTPEPHPNGSNYFAFFGEPRFLITDGNSATFEPITCVLGSDDVLYYSVYRHDYKMIPGGFVDGGRDYIRCSIGLKTFQIVIRDDQLLISDE